MHLPSDNWSRVEAKIAMLALFVYQEALAAITACKLFNYELKVNISLCVFASIRLILLSTFIHSVIYFPINTKILKGFQREKNQRKCLGCSGLKHYGGGKRKPFAIIKAFASVASR
jgi:hypothetical protein